MGLADRMKRYESQSESRLLDRTPVIIRVDGRHFHSFTSDMKEPFNQDLKEAMKSSAHLLCQEISGAQLAYIQSDEISVLVTPYTSLNFEPFLDNRIQKLASICASIATRAFNLKWNELKDDGKTAMFDARAFNLPKNEVCNYFIWRQQDWERNSVQMLGRDYFSHNELHGLSNDEIQEKLWQEEDVNWAELKEWEKNGIALRRETVKEVVDHPEAPDTRVERNTWEFYETDWVPQFTEDRHFINSRVFVEDGEDS